MIKTIKKETLPENCFFEKGIFFSDLHAGGNGDFNRKSFFKAYSWALKQGFEPQEFYFLGDIFDVTGAGKSLAKLMLIFPELAKKVKLGLYLKGNHEGPISELAGILNIFGLYACHGHNIEWLFTGWRKPLGWLICSIAGILERLGWKDIDKTPADMNEQEYLSYYTDKVIPWANTIFEKEKNQLLITGHTHRPNIIKYDNDCILANCGDFVGHNTFIMINNGMIKLMRVT